MLFDIAPSFLRELLVPVVILQRLVPLLRTELLPFLR
jgi:hypothetical protein